VWCGGAPVPVYFIDYFLDLVNLDPLNQAGKPSKGLLSNAFSLAAFELALL
jgi:hypothetical protein